MREHAVQIIEINWNSLIISDNAEQKRKCNEYSRDWKSDLDDNDPTKNKNRFIANGFYSKVYGF